jgi:nucleoside-diphosphate-sugar epimerase
MRILVTSGSGLTGNAFRRLAATKYSGHEFFFHSKSAGDLSVTDVFSSLLAKVKPDVIIHNAGKLHGSFASEASIVESKKINANIFDNLIKEVRPYQQVYSLSSYHVFPSSAPFSVLDLESLNWETSYAQEKSRQIVGALFHPNVNFVILPHLFGEYDNFLPGRAHFVANSIRRVVAAQQQHDEQIEFFGSESRVLQFSTADLVADYILNTIFSDLASEKRYLLVDVGWVRTCYEVFTRICDIVGFNGAVVAVDSDKNIVERDMYYSSGTNQYNSDEIQLLNSLRVAVDYFKRSEGKYVD